MEGKDNNMKRFACWCGSLLIGLATGVGTVSGFELEPSVNSAGVIEYPTAFDQFNDNTAHATIELFDPVQPDLALENVRYGYQTGALQIIGDVFLLTTPGQEHDFDHAVLRLKLRLLQFDIEHTAIAVGGLARITDDKAGEERINNLPFSFLGVVTTELFPFDNWGGFQINIYLDNRVAALGLKGQIYHFIQGLVEIDFFHALEREDREEIKAGFEIAGEEDYYFQLFFAERTEHVFVQIGVGY